MNVQCCETRSSGGDHSFLKNAVTTVAVKFQKCSTETAQKLSSEHDWLEKRTASGVLQLHMSALLVVCVHGRPTECLLLSVIFFG